MPVSRGYRHDARSIQTLPRVAYGTRDLTLLQETATASAMLASLAAPMVRVLLAQSNQGRPSHSLFIFRSSFLCPVSVTSLTRPLIKRGSREPNRTAATTTLFTRCSFQASPCKIHRGSHPATSLPAEVERQNRLQAAVEIIRLSFAQTCTFGNTLNRGNVWWHASKRLISLRRIRSPMTFGERDSFATYT